MHLLKVMLTLSEPYTPYIINMTALTSAGAGEAVSDVNFTAQGSEFTNTLADHTLVTATHLFSSQLLRKCQTSTSLVSMTLQ